VADNDLLQAIDPYIQSESTGTAMVVFTDNSLGRIYLNAGVPTSARYRNKEGMEALEMCKSMDVQTVKFHNNTDIVRSRELLQSNYEVIEALNRPEVIVPDETASLPISGNILTPSNRQRLGSLLSEFIGPVAPLVMTDLPATVDVETALSIVSREIDDTRRAAEFVATARQFLD
jgi:hypothetical protein